MAAWRRRRCLNRRALRVPPRTSLRVRIHRAILNRPSKPLTRTHCNQLAEAHDEVVRQLLAPARQAWRELLEERPWEAVAAFARAVDWTEPWLAALLALQLALFVSVFVMRRRTGYLAGVFCFGGASCKGGQTWPCAVNAA